MAAGSVAGNPPAEFVPLLKEIAADVRPNSLRTRLLVIAETDQRDLLPRIAVPTLLIWGDLDARSPLTVARQFHALHRRHGDRPVDRQRQVGERCGVQVTPTERTG